MANIIPLEKTVDIPTPDENQRKSAVLSYFRNLPDNLCQLEQHWHDLQNHGLSCDEYVDLLCNAAFALKKNQRI